MFSDVERPPSVFLPALRSIKACSEKDISDAISRLRTLYLPPVRGCTRRRPRSAESAQGGLTSRLIKDSLKIIHADPFERSFSIQWLTRVISIWSEAEESASVLEDASSLLAVCAGAAASGDVTRTFTFATQHQPNNLAVICDPQAESTSSSATLTPTSVLDLFQTDDKAKEIRMVLRDAPLESADFSSVGAQTWGGSCILAEMIVEDPGHFGIRAEAIARAHTCACQPFRALELGAGTGLGSLVLAKVLQRVRCWENDVPFTGDSPSTSRPDREREPDLVVATDFHRSVLANLRVNVEANFSSDLPDRAQRSLTVEVPTAHSLSAPNPRVTVLPLDWSSIHALQHPNTTLHEPLNSDADAGGSTHHFHAAESEPQPQSPERDNPILKPPLDAPFDLIIGADIIYESLHARWIRSCVERFLRKPAPPFADSPQLQPGPKHDPALFHLIIPLRRTHTSESRTVEEVFASAKEVLTARIAAEAVGQDGSAIPHAVSGIEPEGPAQNPQNPPSELELAILSQEDIECDAYADEEEVEEVVYRYYRIGWM